MAGVMKGLNDMEFGIGDIVRVKPGCISSRLVGAIGVLREKEKCLWGSNIVHVVEVPKSVIDCQVILDNGISINAISMEGKDLEYAVLTKDDENLLTTLLNQRVNNKHNTWEVRIRPSTDDKNTTYAELYVNGRFEGAEYVSRYHADEYNAGTACIEACKKLFGVKEAENIGKDEEAPVPKYYTGKVVCISGNKFFTKGKVYEVENGAVCDDEGGVYACLEGVFDMCAQLNAEFIEFVE